MIASLLKVPVHVRIVIVVNHSHVCLGIRDFQLINKLHHELFNKLEVVLPYTAGGVNHDAEIKRFAADCATKTRKVLVQFRV